MSSNAEHSPLLLLVSAPSGGGKTTLSQELLAARPALTRAITCTTRPPRNGERDGIDYFFLDVETFEQRVQAGAFLEHAQVFGNRYGTLKSEVMDRLRAGRDVLLSIDVQGAASVRDQARDDAELKRALVTLFLTPPSMAVLEERLRKRKTDAPAVIERRLGEARHELAEWPHFDYLMISGSVSEDLRRVLAIIEVEKMRVHRVPAPAL
jgi:guanylate kinase